MTQRSNRCNIGAQSEKPIDINGKHSLGQGEASRGCLDRECAREAGVGAKTGSTFVHGPSPLSISSKLLVSGVEFFSPVTAVG